ncbi:glutamate receptor 2.8-like [Pyrus ussuriensis x Pyrus communis]|uniref:Glutamate receptor 2.8-like n=1 Tax=Pyrus ussuriensis x Pyrus communis TaxID=2448454 RepID=A0A5N5I146_9ROSA|nr:glutamate receptor 2.8-like [Pyrus ussuriensis x Pyrus communis]
MTMQTSVFIVHMLSSIGSRLFAKAKEMGMMAEGYVWIIIDGMTSYFGSLNVSILDNIQGVLGVKTYVEKTQDLENFRVKWQRKFQKDNPTILNIRLDVFGLWAYDVVWALVMGIEKVGTTTNFNFQKLNNIARSTSNNTILEKLRFSQNGPELVQALSSTIFRGLSGNFSLVNG